MSAVLADTHVIIWFLNSPARLSAPALEALRSCVAAGGTIYISAITIGEILYLIEKSRIPSEAWTSLDTALREPTASILVAPVTAGVARGISRILRDDVPDMPDRIIAATALHLGIPLVTRDHAIRASVISTIW